jgi:glycosyltransferase involved in cell wall biosynthesis
MTIRVALIAGTYQPEQCGVADYTAHLKKQLMHQDIEWIILTTHHAAQTVNDPGVLGVVKDWRLSSLISLAQAVHALKVDRVHIQHAAGTYGFDRAIFLLPLLLKLTGLRAPIITTIHEYGWWEWQPPYLPPVLLERLKTWGQRRGWWDREDGFLLTHSEQIIVTNQATNRVLQSRLPELMHRVTLIPIGANVSVTPIDRAEARQAIRQTCGWSEDSCIAAFFGFLHPVKGLETLLPAFKQVVAVQPNARLLLIGGVESLALPDEQASRYWDQLETMIARLNLNGIVQLTGYLDADSVSRCLSGVDIGVLPFNHGVTLKSGSLLTLMAHSLPVVATCPDASGTDLTTLPVDWTDCRDSDGLATKLLELIRSADRRYQRGTAAHRFSQQFAWYNIAKAHREIYRSACAPAIASGVVS